MSDEQKLYDEAFKQMGTAPLEYNENIGPKDGRQSYRMQVPHDLYKEVKRAAHDQGISMNEFIIQALSVAVNHNQSRPITLAWIKVARWGEIDDHDAQGNIALECPECGQDMDKGNCYVALLSNGQHYGPVCDICATNEYRRPHRLSAEKETDHE